MPNRLCLLSLLMAAGCASAVEANDSPPHAGAALPASRRGPEVPAILAVPAGHRFAFSAEARGAQVYVCAADSDGAGTHSFSWTLKAPDASLFDQRGRPLGTHFGGPTWKGVDGSTVVATGRQVYDRNPNAIPWLLLQATATTGHGMMSKVTYIQRLDTRAGLAPKSGCDANTAGETRRVEYSATYQFFEAERPKQPKH